MQNRYPHLFEKKEAVEALWTYLSTSGPEVQRALLASLGIEKPCWKESDDEIKQILCLVKIHFSVELLVLPSLLYFQAMIHLEDVDSTHCTPLPKEAFQLPQALVPNEQK